MKVRSGRYRPKFVKKELNGRYAPKLFMGFEAEMGCIIDQRGHDYIDDINKDFSDILYAKDDGSVDFDSYGVSLCGMELNSHPFNWNWLLKNHKFLDKIEEMKHIKERSDYSGYKATKARVNRSCGFHIHLSREYFTKLHLLKMAKFFYTNTNFIRKISLRGNTQSFNQYSSLKLWENDLNDIMNKERLPCDREIAINFCHTKTVEIRIFQGTLYKETILAYLEFALAVSMFTKKFKWDNMTEDKFITYVNKSSKTYSHLIKLIEGELKWK